MPHPLIPTNTDAWNAQYDQALHSASNARALENDEILGRQAGSLYQAAPDLESQASRQMQLSALAQQYAAARGEGPSAASAQQQQLGGQAMLSALGSRSMGAASSGLSAVAQQAAGTRAGEMQAAMGGYGEGTGQLRSSDLAYQQGAYGLANAQQQVYQQQAAQNAAYLQGREQHQFDVGLALTKDAQARHNMLLQRQEQAKERIRQGKSAAIAGALTVASMGAASPVAGKVGDSVAGE